MTFEQEKYELKLPYTDQWYQNNLQRFNLNFVVEENCLCLKGSRLMFSADAFGDLRKDIIDSIGQDNARLILFRFGYQCGARDAVSSKEKAMENRDTDNLLKLFFDQNRGIVFANNGIFKFKENGKLLVMEGAWHNSYEVAQHIRCNGLSKETVCWSLSGYASGYASEILNDDLLCIETQCIAKGDQACIYEMRPTGDWPQEVTHKWLGLQKAKEVTNPEILLFESKRNLYQKQLMSECLGQITRQTEEDTLLLKLIYYVHRLVKAQYTALYYMDEGNKKAVMKNFVGNEKYLDNLASIDTVTMKAHNFGEAYLQSEANEIFGSLHLLAIPIIATKVTNYVVVIVTEQKNDFETMENIKLLFHVCQLILEKLQLMEELSVLRDGRKAVQQSMRELTSVFDKTRNLLNIILEGKGIKGLIKELGEQMQAHVVLINERGEITEQNLEISRAKNLLRQLHHEDNTAKKFFLFPLRANGKKLGELLVVERHRWLGSEEKLLLGVGAKVIALEIIKEQEAQLDYHYNFFKVLVSGEYSSREVLLNQANKVGFSLDGVYQLIGLALDDQSGNPMDACSYEILCYQVSKYLKEQSLNSKIFIFSNLLLIFLSFQDKKWEQKNLEVFVNDLLKNIKKYFTDHKSYLVAGRICKELNHYPMSYQEIKSCISIMKRLKQNDRAIYFEKLGVLAILFEVEQKKLVDFINKVLGPLFDCEEITGLELLPTLSYFVKNNFNIQLTARNHYISASTLKYRLRKIRDFTGIDLDDPDVRLNIQLALKLTDYQ